MAINPLSSNIVDLLSLETLTSKGYTAHSEGGSFADIFTEALNTVSVSDTADKASALALLAGQTDDMAGLIIDSQKAEIALTLALTLRNKVMEAYTEIMRMQV
ncbi:MAG: flagellar hook-basal body complex protein FliE [Firmicutes bacterium]|nr:flagellar hook-basal body complex protein FliE [Bacillota bacterium]